MVSNSYTKDDDYINTAPDILVVQALEFDGTTWTKIGGNVHQGSLGPKSGYFVRLSDDGLTIVMGDPGKTLEEVGTATLVFIKSLLMGIGGLKKDPSSTEKQTGICLDMALLSAAMVLTFPLGRLCGASLPMMLIESLRILALGCSTEGLCRDTRDGRHRKRRFRMSPTLIALVIADQTDLATTHTLQSAIEIRKET